MWTQRVSLPPAAFSSGGQLALSGVTVQTCFHYTYREEQARSDGAPQSEQWVADHDDSVLGSGGFGHVYQAVDEQTNQKFAVKEYLVTGSSGKAQLDHEARVLSQLHHPSMPAFRDAFDERGRYYIILGYIEGNDLTDCLRLVRQKNETIPIERILTWILSICEAVIFLHNQNPPIIHRDIKPDNIRITPNGTAILVDLGNAKSAADGSRTLFFIRHQGTPGYAPLEQYPGGTGTDTRSDVWLRW